MLFSIESCFFLWLFLGFFIPHLQSSFSELGGITTIILTAEKQLKNDFNRQK